MMLSTSEGEAVMTHEQVMAAWVTGAFALAYVTGTLIEFFTRRPQTITVPSEDGKSVVTKEVYQGADLGCLIGTGGFGTVICAAWFLWELICG